MDVLKCGIPGCRATIRGITGFQELQKLRQHMWRAHSINLDIAQALEWRVKFEAQQEAEEHGRS